MRKTFLFLGFCSAGKLAFSFAEDKNLHLEKKWHSLESITKGFLFSRQITEQTTFLVSTSNGLPSWDTPNHFKTLKPKLFEKRLNAAWSFDGKSWTEVRFRRIPTSSKQSLVSVARFFDRRVECCECSIGVLRCRSPFSSHWRSRLKGESPKEQSYYSSLDPPRLLLGPVEAILKVRWLVGKGRDYCCSQRLLCPWTCSWPHKWWDHLHIY